MNLEDIGEGDAALRCMTDQPACCRPPYTGQAIGNWYFPNGTRAPSSGAQWDFHRTRGDMMVLLHRRKGGVEGVYYCVVPNAMNVIQTIYIGIYSTNTGEWYVCTLVTVYTCSKRAGQLVKAFRTCMGCKCPCRKNFQPADLPFLRG